MRPNRRCRLRSGAVCWEQALTGQALLTEITTDHWLQLGQHLSGEIGGQFLSADFEQEAGHRSFTSGV